MLITKTLFRCLTTMLAVASTSHAQADSFFSFYPLHIGNSWQYRSTYVNRIMGGEVGRSSHYYILNVLSDTTLKSGKRYFMLQSTDKYSPHPRYQRVDSLTSQVFAFDTANGGREYVIDSLRAPARSSFRGCRSPFLTATFVSEIDTQIYFGIHRVSRHYLTPRGIGAYIEYTLSEGLGITIFEGGSYDSDQYPGGATYDTLVYARIDGREYGTLVSTPNIAQTPIRFLVYQNYPNPFNPATIIKYQLPEDVRVSLKVFDLLGQEVITLVDEAQEAGSYNVTFSANHLSTGVYFYRLEAGHFAETKRLMLLK